MNTSFGGSEEVHEDSTKDSTKVNKKPAKYFSEEIQSWSTDTPQDVSAQNLQINLFPFPYCISKEGSIRRMGVSIGPSKFLDSLNCAKFAPILKR